MTQLSKEELAALGSLVMFRLSKDLTEEQSLTDKELIHDLKGVKIDEKAAIKQSLANPMDVENKYPSGDLRNLYEWMFDYLVTIPGKLIPIEINPPWPPDLVPLPTPPSSPRCPKFIYYMRSNLGERILINGAIASLEQLINGGAGTPAQRGTWSQQVQNLQSQLEDLLLSFARLNALALENRCDIPEPLIPL